MNGSRELFWIDDVRGDGPRSYVEERRRLGLTQRQVGRAAKLSINTISRIERGEGTTVDSLRAYLGVLGFDVVIARSEPTNREVK